MYITPAYEPSSRLNCELRTGDWEPNCRLQGCELNNCHCHGVCGRGESAFTGADGTAADRCR